MKKLTFIMVALMVSMAAFAQVKISTGGGNPDASSMLEVESTTKGFLLPRMTTGQRDAISLPAEGLQVFNTTSKCLQIYINGSWQSVYCPCTIPATPGSIIGDNTPCSGSSGNSYSIASVAGATTYTWTVPSGASITGGQGTTSITVTFGSTSGNISVTAGNTCGTSSENTLAVTLGSAGGSGTQTLSYTGSLQTFTIPCGVTSIVVESWGAQGGGHISNCGGNGIGGLGAYIKGTFAVTAGDQLNILVGGQGQIGEYSGGGGGGSFVWTSGNTLLVAAGGGGGGTSNGGINGANGSATTTPTGGGGSGTGAGGISGNGGSAGTCNSYSRVGSGGAGWLGNGQNNTCGSDNTGGKSPANGGAGGSASTSNGGGNGGYGGGGGSAGDGAQCGAGGGGGGYNGGGGGNGYISSRSSWGQGGGGSSFNGGISQTNTSGIRSGNGQVIITW